MRAGRKRSKVKGNSHMHGVVLTMTEQNRRYLIEEIGKLLSDFWRIKELADQDYGPQHIINKKLANMHEDAPHIPHFRVVGSIFLQLSICIIQ
jgi:hypothetical protein